MSRLMEFRIPIAPNKGFYSNVRLAATSLAALGEPYASASIIVAPGKVADIESMIAENPWAADYPIHWYVPAPESTGSAGQEAGGRKDSFPGFMRDRFPHDTDSDVVIHCDADVCVLRRFDDLVDRLCNSGPAFAGCMAHYTPFPGDAAQNDASWTRLFTAAGMPEPALNQRYVLADEEYPGRSPPYFNAGFMAMNRDGWRRIADDVDYCTRMAVPFLRDLGREFFAIQVAITLAIARQAIDVVHVGLEHNCPNDDKVFAHGISAEEDVRVLHYLREDEFVRQLFLSDPAAFERFANGPLQGRMNRHFRKFVLSLAGLR